MKRSVYLKGGFSAFLAHPYWHHTVSAVLNKFLVVFLLGFIFTSYVAAQESLPSENSKSITSAPAKIMNNGFFSYEVTGNADVDAENYRKAKENFVNNDPAGYQKMINEQASGKSKIDKKEFEQLPKEKQQHILANPSKYEIIELPPK